MKEVHAEIKLESHQQYTQMPSKLVEVVPLCAFIVAKRVQGSSENPSWGSWQHGGVARSFWEGTQRQISRKSLKNVKN